jgi:6-phosphogluconate dehydrogenase
MDKRHLGIIGLGVMGRSLALNAESKGFSVAGFELDPEKSKQLTAQFSGKKVTVTSSLKDFADALERPRRIWMMVPAGKPVDAALRDLGPYLEKDDIVIDGGNSHFKDTERRARELEASGFRFFGMGVSGGEEGALQGPSLMPGGHEPSYRYLEAVLTRMAAQTTDGPCCTYLGPGGSGHYVKMVHNGMEYGIMQAISDAYYLLTRLRLGALEIRDLFAEWNRAELGSFLMEISATVLGKIDPETGKPLVDLVLDTAGQKGTGKWTAQDALDLGLAIPTLAAAVEARILSGAKQERLAASKILLYIPRQAALTPSQLIPQVRQALNLTVVACYAQGFEQLQAASKEYSYKLNLAEVARIWKGGCIIRSKMLDPIQAAFRSRPDLRNLMLDPHFAGIINQSSDGLREVAKTAIDLGIPCPAFSASLSYIDGYRQARLPANLLQAQRDYFGAHTYRRIDREGVFHTEWDKP